MTDPLAAAVQTHLPDATRFLQELVRIPSLPGQEQEAMLFCERAFAKLGVQVERVPLSDAIKQDPDYSDPIPDLRYDGRFNLRVVRKGMGRGKKLLVNAHTDVVPPSEGMTDPWSGRVENGVLYGRGACDDKGQVAVLWLALKALDAAGVRTAGDLVGHLVVEEENGGNGTLAMARTKETADGCIVLEASEGRLFTSIRGAVWFRIVFQGVAGHSGQAGQTRSALLMARDAIAALEDYHAALLAASRGFPLFDPHPNPMPITFGRLEAGNWPAAAPSRATMEGVLGLLPNTTKEQVMDGMRAALDRAADGALKGCYALTFMYRHDSSVVTPAHPFPRALLDAAEAAGAPLEVGAMTASCDAWFYNNQLGIPTVVLGAGTLKVAHSKEEQIPLASVAATARTLAAFAQQFCV
ncbi:MAG: M20/M25/M40 family metallo-hydrolase [Verrucomicrobiae bacterium]|nr:M20/M25/M40 family metallo-hydrolase [Verrucomicrobiae bacterium]